VPGDIAICPRQVVLEFGDEVRLVGIRVREIRGGVDEVAQRPREART